MLKKFKIAVIVTILIMFLAIVIGCTSNTEKKDSTTNTDSNYYKETKTDDTYETNDEANEDYDEDEDDKIDDMYETNYEYKSELESKLEDIANEVVRDVITNDYKVTYQYEQENDTGYIFLTWLGASDADKKTINTFLETSGFKEQLQEIANYTAEELQYVSHLSVDVKPINGAVILRDMNSKILYSCYNE